MDLLDAIAEHQRADRLTVLRCDVTDDAAWGEILAALREQHSLVEPLPAPELAGLGWTAVQDALCGRIAGYVVVVDARSVVEQASGRAVTVMLVDLAIDAATALEEGDETLGHVRCRVHDLDALVVNLDLGNLDFADFSEHVDEDGVLHGLGFSEDEAGGASGVGGAPSGLRRRVLDKVWWSVRSVDEHNLGAFPPAARAVAAGADPTDVVRAMHASAYEVAFEVLELLTGEHAHQREGDLYFLHEDLLSSDPSGVEGRDFLS